MRAVFTEEQEMLRSTASRIAESVAVTTPGDLLRLDRAGAWRALAEAGLLGMRARDAGVPMTSGLEVMLVAESLAGAIAPTPFVGGLLAAELLALGKAPQASLDELAEGRVRYCILLDSNLDGIADAEALQGAICFDSDGAAFGLALLRQGSQTRLARVPLDGMTVLDGADLTRQIARPPAGVAAEPMGEPLSSDDLARWTALALTLTCADIVGVLGVGLRRVVDYAKTRMQYGVPIGSFQAVQHMCADMLVATQAAASVTHYAAWGVDALDPAAALLAARTAKAYCAPVAQQAGEMLMQAYGGIGQTWEHEAHIRTRRAMFDRKVFGDEGHQLLAISDARLANRGGSR